MATNNNFLFLLLLLFNFHFRLSFSDGDSNSMESVPDLQKSMYKVIDGYPCVRLLSLSGPIGCSILYDDYYGRGRVSGVYSTGAGAPSGPALKRFLVIEKEKYFMMMHTYCVRIVKCLGDYTPPGE
uniref:Uncharacterized protein n=1 Tax=Quercus lobata TaxID=97700 RepID=A0A7N2KY87_QUELO